MQFDNTQPHASDALSLTELDLYHLIMEYRAASGLAPIPLSESLTTTAGRHSADTLYNIWEPNLTLPVGANLHSWSDAPYLSDHSLASNMWDAPERIGTDYTGAGFEISAAGYGSIAAALTGWQGSSGHDAVIVNDGVWANYTWNAIGIGVEHDPSVGRFGGNVYHVWFGREADPAGNARIDGTELDDTIKATAFRDVIRGGEGADDISGLRGRDKIFGGDGRDDISGGGGRDKLNGGRGADKLEGGGKTDIFVFKGQNFGRDKILDYDGDKIRIKTAGEAATQTELAAAMSEKNGNTVYDHLGDGKNVIVFQDVSLAALDLTLFDLG